MAAAEVGVQERSKTMGVRLSRSVKLKGRRTQLKPSNCNSQGAAQLRSQDTTCATAAGGQRQVHMH